MFQLTTGPYRALELSLLEHILAEKKADPLAPLLVLSPSGHQLDYLQRQLAMRATGSFLNIHFLTFYAFAERLMAEGPLSDGRVVTEPALFREIIFDYLEGRGEIPFLSRGSLRRSGGPVPKGLPGALAATLKDLQDSGARVVDCANVAREGHLGDAVESAIPALELNVLMYDVLRKHGLRTGADFIRRAKERIPQSRWIQNQKALFLYGFYDLTGVQLDFVLELTNHPHTRVYFPYEEGHPAYTFAEKLLKDPAFTSKIVPGSTLIAKPETRDCDVDVFSCSGAHDEIWLAAKKILQLADSGVPYHRMALLARTLDPYLNTLRDVLEAHHIPYALHTEEPVGAYPLIKTARQLLRSRPDAAEASWSSHIRWAKNRLSSSPEFPTAATVDEKSLWEGLFATLDGLVALDALERPVSQERFLAVVEEKLEGLRLPLTGDRNAGVQVMDVMTARGLSFDAVFLVGLNEKLFPRLIREDPFLSDTARSKLSGALGCRLGRKMDGYQEERLLFHLATGSARRKLHLSCQRSDEEGKALVISLYLHDFLRNTGLEPKRLSRSWPEKIREVPPDTLTPKEVSLAFHRERRDTDALYRELGWDRELIRDLLQSQKEIEAFGPLGAHDGLIGKDHPLAQAILARGLSPNTLKDLAECPFKIYGRKILSLDPEEKDVEQGEITRSAQGKVIHEILEAFYRERPAEWEEGLNKIAQTVFPTFAKNYPELYPLAWVAAQNKILAMLKRFIPLDLAELKESGLTPRFFEADIGEEINGQALQGRIDRLDLREGVNPAFRVVDYKTGRAGIGKKDKVETAILKGKNFQLPVYLALAEAWLNKASPGVVRHGSAVFYRLQEEDALESPLKIDSGFWEEYGDRFYKNLRFLVKDIENGSFYIRPSDSHGYCGWCAFDPVCRRTHKPTQTRSETSPQRRAHEECFKP